ncbi:MAG: Hpt domain-containing protein [Gammaproteobacteria bacterium]|jgi:chemosensory pili system protein ChpA (sensor histidine kinase/response regulator)
MQELAGQSLELVSLELTQTLETARGEIEDYVDGQSDSEALVRAASLLHLAAGALKIVEIHGAALLAEEMEQTCLAVHEGDAETNAEQAAEALTAAMVQLPAYLDRLMSGGSDVALVLLPLLNDLRTARNRPMLSEGTMLLLNSGPFERFRDTSADEAVQDYGSEVPTLAQQLRPRFQSALLGWIRGDESGGRLGELIEVCDALKQQARAEPVRQLWAVTAGVLAALKHGDYESSIAIKRLMGQVDRQLKRLIDSGEQSFVSAPPVELMNSLLYYVARSTSDDPRLNELKETFDLETAIPDAEEIEQAREDLAGPSVNLMLTVAEAIKEDLGQVKDVLDIFVRTGMESVAELKPQLDMLRKIADTLGVLGLEAPRNSIQAKAEELAAVVAADSVEDASVIEGIAMALLDVEDVLARELVGTASPERGEGAGEADDENDSTQYRHVTAAVMRECIVNLAKVKEIVVKVIEDPSSLKTLDQVESQMRGIVAGLLMLNKNRAVNVIERISRTITRRLAPAGDSLAPQLLERLADAIVSIEYYMETVALGRSDPFYMLDNANRCLDVLDRLPAREPEPEVELSDESESSTVTGVSIEPMRSSDAEAPPATAAQPEPQAEQPADRAEGLAVMAVDDDRSKPELVEIFIEEAKEEIEKIQELLPRWSSQPEDSDALIGVRRSFHTLKGSGRMVGAELIGEFAWSIENLLNRVINKTIDATPQVFDFVGEAATVLPGLVEQLEAGIAPAADIGAMIVRAEAIAEGRSEVAAAAAVPETEADRPSMDPVLTNIFVKEVREHSESVRKFAREHAGADAPVEITESLHRACHTLRGSARMANCEQALAVVEPVDAVISQAFNGGEKLAAEGVATLERFAIELERLCAALQADQAFTPDPEVIDAVAALELAASVELTDKVPSLVAATDEGTGATGAAPMLAAAPDYDPEIAGIFCEEASELLDQAETELQTIRESEHADTAIAELKRVLHTLKGGARLAGIAAMGDLSHALETMLPQLAGSAADSDGIRLAQQALDRLHQMRDAVDGGQPAPAAGELVVALERCGGEPLGPDDTLSLPTTAPFEPSEITPAESGAAETQATESEPDAEAEQGEQHERAAEAEQGEGHDGVAEVEPGAAGESAVEPEPMPALEPVVSEAPAVAAPRAERVETARVDAALLDELLNEAGEISIFQSRLNQQVHSIEFHLGELGQTVTRLREQLRSLEAETEAQILHRHQGDTDGDDEFDPLELDRYSTIQQLSRALAETSADVASINELLHGLTSEADTLLTQQSRVTTELQDGLMQTRMVPFERQASRLSRIVRQTANEKGKAVELELTGAENMLDRQILEAILPALEHLLRNAVVHGIEPAEKRTGAGKPANGTVSLAVRREGSEVLIEVSDDGAGLDTQAIRRKAIEKGLIQAGDTPADDDIVELILLPGFSTADELTQSAGRGVGMDVVDNEVKRLGGSLRITTEVGHGTQFLIRLPYTLAITHALIVNVGEETFALPLPTIEGIARVRREELLDILTQDDPRLTHGDGSYRVQHLGSLVGGAPSPLPEDEGAVSLVLVRAGENSAALLTDTLEGSREIIVKTLGPHVASVDGVTGATILGDGRVVVILDPGTLVRAQPSEQKPAPAAPVQQPENEELTGLVVDDSITMRRVTQRLLERRGVNVHTARDGLDAIEVLREHDPDFIVLDIEMPRMDGYQFATHVRNDPRHKDLPIIMVTSRSGEKHRARAIEIGVNDYLSKPYQETDLIKSIESLVGRSL